MSPANDQDALRKVGRGGAGNYYSAKEADDASKDLEAQKLNLPIDHVPPGVGLVARAGRGGAGNFVDPAQNARDQEQLAHETAAAVRSNVKNNNSNNHQAQGGGLSGRGGAGNFNSSSSKAEQAKRREEEDKSRIAHLETKVKEAVESGLKVPEKVHHGLEKYKP
ncbi:hypothetical protein PT974_08275 [Cladobotryum mycophilum]|uniref:Uncharacterized protein n=1 Tax=Cladobotryum mycophilum TaxID=491253 RepID=A0ABR0SCW5_9HYPO